MSSSTTHEEDHGEILVLSDYPFYVKGPPQAEIAKAAAQCEAVLKEACGDQLVEVERMGSSAIPGIAGTPVCDVLAQMNPWPVSDEAKAKLAAKGYECKGAAVYHDPEDEWFFGGPGQPGHLGRIVLHTVPAGSRFVSDMRAFVAYVRSHPDAFERYNNVKIEGAREMMKSYSEEGRLIGYKMKKNTVCNQIKKEAIEWWKTQPKEP